MMVNAQSRSYSGVSGATATEYCEKHGDAVLTMRETDFGGMRVGNCPYCGSEIDDWSDYKRCRYCGNCIVWRY